VRRRSAVTTVCTVCLLATGGLPRPAHGQPPSIHPETERVRAYAPMLWLANSEPFYPSLPHPYAFDGFDNDGDGRVDIADPDEISLALRRPRKADRLADLEGQFRMGRPEARVLYKYEPSGLELRNENPLGIIQLWFYYVVDAGSGSHDGDSEHAFLFLNNEQSFSRDKTRSVAIGGLRAVVGAGHTDDTANNILATGSMQSPTGVMPARLPMHMPLLVELGKHATAPDLTMDSRFNPGIDSNVFRQAAWGSRDGFGVDVLEFLGGYREAYSQPRNVRDLILEGHALAEGSIEQYREDFPHYFTDASQFEGNRKYRFLPIADLETIFAILTSEDDNHTKRDNLSKHLEEHAECFWPAGRQPKVFALDDYQFAAFLHWLDVSDSHMKVWDKRDYKEPEDIFKMYLFPRVELGFSTMWTQDRPQGQLLGAMLRVAEFSVGSTPALNDSSLEAYANFATGSGSLYDFGLTYRYFRGGFGGPYFGMGWRGEQRRGTADLTADELQAATRLFGEAAASVPTRFERHTGLDLGYAISWNVSRLKLTRRLKNVTLGGMFGLRSELFAENLSPVEEALNPDLPRRTRFQAKFTVHVGVLGPRHPLQR